MIECLGCGRAMSVTTEDVPFAFSGLGSVVLEGVEVRRCECGEEEVVVGRMDAVHEEIANKLIEKPGRLAAEEFRFLRKVLGVSGVQFAEQMGVAPETVSRWENGEPIGKTAERAMRLLVGYFLRSRALPGWLGSLSGDASPLPLRIRSCAGAGSLQMKVIGTAKVIGRIGAENAVSAGWVSENLVATQTETVQSTRRRGDPSDGTQRPAEEAA